MKWKILIKLLYLIILLGVAALPDREESQLIDSDPSADNPTIYNASIEEVNNSFSLASVAPIFAE